MSKPAQDEETKTPVIVTDFLEHDDFSSRLLSFIEKFGQSKVVSLRGPWGRGKTDVLLRTYGLAQKRIIAPDSSICGSVWINPWQYGRFDLLSPLLDALLPKIPAEKLEKEKEQIKQILKGMVGATVGSAFKVAGLGDIGTLVNKLVDDLIKASDSPSPYTKDPVAPLGVAFKELLTKYIIKPEHSNKDHFLIFVDDLDRCLPERQIALLEAFHFLVDAGAPATIIMAVDPEILSIAARTHYGADHFDINRYLDKIFDFNIELPPLTSDSLGQFAQSIHHTAKTLKVAGSHISTVPDTLGSDLVDALAAHPNFRNPRVLERMATKLLYVYDKRSKLVSAGPLSQVLFWLLWLQTWPEARISLDFTLSRGPATPMGDADQQTTQAFIELYSTSQLPAFMLFQRNTVKLGDKAVPVRELVKTYTAMQPNLRDLAI